MKSFVRFAVIVSASFIFSSCGVSQQLNSHNISQIQEPIVAGSGSSGDITLNSGQLKSPIVFDSIGSNLYFRTDKGTFYLDREPAKVISEANRWTGIWNYSGSYKLTVAINHSDGRFYLSMTASPEMSVTGWGFSISSEPDEYFTGIFERTVDGNQANSWRKGITEAMDLRGQKVSMLIRPTVSLYCPFYISSRNYSLFVEGTWPGTYDFCKTEKDKVKIFFEGPAFSAVIDTGEPGDLVKRHSLRVGPTILPPKWTFGPWRWRDNHSHNREYYDGSKVKAPFNSEVVEDILMMKAFGIPCSVYWVDRPWAKGGAGYDDFDWDLGRFPNARQMINWIHDGGMRFVLWIAPWVNGDMSSYAVNYHYNIKNQKGHSNDRPLIDFSNPSARQWWQLEGIRKILLDGVDGFKLDRSEELMPEDRVYKNFIGKTNREYRNEYPVDYVKAVWEITKQIKGDDFVLMPRAGYTNSSRYGVFWAGDIGSPPEALRSAIIAQQRSAIMGYPIWGSDTGGYWQGALDREVCGRWLAFSCFSPIMEVGPTEDKGLWDMKKEPHYDTELIAIWRLYAILHNELRDYSYNQAVEAHKTGMPIVRPLFVHWPDQNQSWQDWQTYMYGPDILVSAIWKKGKDSHTLYLPAGVKWVNAWDGKTYNGGDYVTVNAPLYKIPIFVREGSGVDLPDLESLYKESYMIASDEPDIKELEKKAFLNMDFD